MRKLRAARRRDEVGGVRGARDAVEQAGHGTQGVQPLLRGLHFDVDEGSDGLRGGVAQADVAGFESERHRGGDAVLVVEAAEELLGVVLDLLRGVRDGLLRFREVLCEQEIGKRAGILSGIDSRFGWE